MNNTIDPNEIEKWLNKLEKIKHKIKPKNNKAEEFLRNMNAYIDDCKHFMSENDLFRALEAVMYAYAIHYVCTELGLFTETHHK